VKKKKVKVAVILAFFNGEKYITQQIRSIFAQTNVSVTIILVDDASREKFCFENLGIPARFREKIKVSINPKNEGFSKTFFKGLKLAPQNFDYFCFCDQDDIWLSDKLERSVKVLEKYNLCSPALYCARTFIADENCKGILGVSPLFSKPPSFENALVQNIAGGNTMVFNKIACNTILASIPKIEVVSHDWWCYLIISGVGGYVIYDENPCLLYRQHNKNLIGQNNSLKSKIRRFYMLFQGKFIEWNNDNVRALLQNRLLLSDHNSIVLTQFLKARSAPLIWRVFYFWKSGVFRQTTLGNIALFIGILFKKV